MGLSGPAYWGRICQSCVFNLLQPTCSSSQRWLTLFSWSSAFPRTQADVSWGEEDAAKNHRVKNVSGASPSREVLNNRSELSDELLCGFAVVISWYSTRLRVSQHVNGLRYNTQVCMTREDPRLCGWFVSASKSSNFPQNTEVLLKERGWGQLLFKVEE